MNDCKTKSASKNGDENPQFSSNISFGNKANIQKKPRIEIQKTKSLLEKFPINEKKQATCESLSLVNYFTSNASKYLVICCYILIIITLSVFKIKSWI